MLGEFHTASSLLRAALERYSRACSALRNGYDIPHKSNLNNSKELLNTLDNELGLIQLYENQLAQAQVEVKKARNDLGNIPINSLPAETLTQIFRLVVNQELCPLRIPNSRKAGTKSMCIPKYADTLAHVCSRWRQIALVSHGLWSHIDIELSCPLSHGSHNRAQAYVVRARRAPLDIHLVDLGYVQPPKNSSTSDNGSEDDSDDDSDDWDDWNAEMYRYNPKEFTFLSSAPGIQVKSLGLFVHGEYHHIHSRALEHCIANCLPGGVASSPSTCSMSLDEASNNQLFLPEQQLESAWYPTTILFLNNKYPRLLSTAYYGLTELHLIGKEQSLSSLELASILRSSPGLRTFECNFWLDIARSLPLADQPVAPVALAELEVLDLKHMDLTSIRHVLRLINPGPKPLRLLLRGPAVWMEKDFFARSNVQEMYTTMDYIDCETASQYNWLWTPPRLRVLVVAGCTWNGDRVSERDEALELLDLRNESPYTAKVDTLYMISCTYENLIQFKEIVAEYSPQRLVLWKCKLRQPRLVTIDLPLLESEFEHNLSQLCPVIECLADTDPNPLWDWD